MSARGLELLEAVNTALRLGGSAAQHRLLDELAASCSARNAVTSGTHLGCDYCAYLGAFYEQKRGYHP